MVWVVVESRSRALRPSWRRAGGRFPAGEKDRERYGGGWPRLAYEEQSRRRSAPITNIVPKGVWVVEYTVRFNNPGSFNLPPTRVEAIYAPGMLGESPNGTITVLP